jgi:hypothetical protein
MAKGAVCAGMRISREEMNMAPQIGERYGCSHCGCELEVTRSGSEALGVGREGDASSGTTRTSDLGRTSGSVGEQSPGDYAAQGATGEGVFGTAGTTHSASAKGRYGSDAPSRVPAGSDEDRSPSNVGAPVCFCGQPMQQTGSRSSTARAR